MTRAGEDQAGIPKGTDELVEDDPVTRSIAKTGCLQLHYAVQECMYEHRDWRKCQEQVSAFRLCIQEDAKKNREIALK